MKAIAYIRVSTDDQTKYSPASQERLIAQCCEHHKLHLEKSFKDDGAHSDTFDRPAYKAMIKYIAAHRDIRYLITYDHSRFARDLLLALVEIDTLQKKYNVKVLTIADHPDTDFNDPAQKIIRIFQLLMAENQLHTIRKNTRNVIIQGNLSGRFMTLAPFGYKNARTKDDHPTLVIVEAKAAIVRFIFREFLNGMSVTEIGREARRQGFSIKGKMGVQRVLSNPVYCGLITVPPHKDRKTRFAKGLHEPIIPEPTYWLVQEKLVRKGPVSSKNHLVPLRGALRCWCGRKMSAGNSKGRNNYYWYYLCSHHREHFPAKKLHERFDRLLECLSVGGERLQYYREKLVGSIEEKLQGKQAELDNLRRDLRSLQIQITNAEKKYLMGTVREETFEEVIAGLKGEEARIEQALEKAQEMGPAYYGRLDELLLKITDFKAAYYAMSPEKQHQFLAMVFDNSFTYRDDSYRTAFIHPAFAHNLPDLQRKRLLILEKPIVNLGENSHMGRSRGPNRTEIEYLVEILELIA